MSALFALGLGVLTAVVTYRVCVRARAVEDLRARLRGEVVDLAAVRRMRALERAVERHPSGRVS